MTISLAVSRFGSILGGHDELPLLFYSYILKLLLASGHKAVGQGFMPLAGVLLHWQVDERKNNSRSVPESEDSQLYNEYRHKAQDSCHLHMSRSICSMQGDHPVLLLRRMMSRNSQKCHTVLACYMQLFVVSKYNKTSSMSIENQQPRTCQLVHSNNSIGNTYNMY